jgi:hypothetical protein
LFVVKGKMMSVVSTRNTRSNGTGVLLFVAVVVMAASLVENSGVMAFQHQHQQQQIRPAMSRLQKQSSPLLMVSTSAAAASSGGEEVQSSRSSSDASSSVSAPVLKKSKKKSYKELRAEGGPFTFNTPIGALNPFAIYYGLMSIFLGIPWFIALKICQFMYLITRNKFDPEVRTLLTSQRRRKRNMYRLSWYSRQSIHIFLSIYRSFFSFLPIPTASYSCLFKSCMGCYVDAFNKMLSNN